MNDNVAVLLLITTGGAFVIVVSFILIFVRNQNRLLRKQTELQETRLLHEQELLRTVIVSQEEERGRIGQDLHDDVGTALSNLRLNIEMFNAGMPGAHDIFARNCKLIIDKVITDVRHISHNLSPPGITQYGLIGALEELCDFMSQTGAVDIHIENNSAYIASQIESVKAISLYRVIEELINNTIKHAGATKINVFFTEYDTNVEVLYTDNGKGIKNDINPSKGMGMHNIESRLQVIGAQILTLSPGRKGYNFSFCINK